MVGVEAYGSTDVGRKRTNNEDTFISQALWDDYHWLAVVIDGVGGYEGGEVAAEIARMTILRYLQEFPDGESLSLLKEAVTQANNSIFEARGKQKDRLDMACVLTACLFDMSEMELHMVHVGDTRLYCYSDRSLDKLSHDHSYVGYYEEMGSISEEDAMNHPQRNIINRVVGDMIHNVDDEKFIDAQTFPLIANATYLLCSDGLHDMLTSAEITSVLNNDILVGDKVKNLIDSANRKGGKDNVTVVLIQIGGDNVHNTAAPEKYSETTAPQDIPVVHARCGKKCRTIIIALCCLFLGLAAGWFGRGLYNNSLSLGQATIAPDSLQTQPAMKPMDVGIVDTLSSEMYE